MPHTETVLKSSNARVSKAFKNLKGGGATRLGKMALCGNFEMARVAT